jgi:ZIP family zinc transporter
MGLIFGIIIMMILNHIVDKVTGTKGEVHSTHEELFHESEVIKNRGNLLRSGIFMLVAMGLHNIPEGIAIGAGGTHDFNLGIIIAMMIALHTIPEGMAVATPLLVAGINRWKVVFLTALAGAPTIIGGIIGVLIGSVSDMAIAMSLAAAGGAMLYIVFGEIIPQSVVMTRSRATSLMALFGIIVGLIVTQM